MKVIQTFYTVLVVLYIGYSSPVAEDLCLYYNYTVNDMTTSKCGDVLITSSLPVFTLEGNIELPFACTFAVS